MILLIFLINDLALRLAEVKVLHRSVTLMYLLLFADDFVLFSTSQDGLQLMSVRYIQRINLHVLSTLKTVMSLE